jgi:hypothetical protein
MCIPCVENGNETFEYMRIHIQINITFKTFLLKSKLHEYFSVLNPQFLVIVTLRKTEYHHHQKLYFLNYFTNISPFPFISHLQTIITALIAILRPNDHYKTTSKSFKIV